MAANIAVIRERQQKRSGFLAGRRVRSLVIRYVLLGLVLLIMIGPILWPLLTSLKAPEEPIFGQDATLFPQQWSLRAYDSLFRDVSVPAYIGNSLLYAMLQIASQVIFATTSGYMLSRRNWRGRSVVLALVVAAIIFPFESIMLSLYTQVQWLGLLDIIAGVWLPGIVGAFNVLLMWTVFSAVPEAIEEAAFIDGAGELRGFFSIFVPSAKGAIIIVILTSFVSAWDDFLWPLLVLQSSENFTLTLGLASLNTSFGFDVRTVMAGAVISLIPVVIIFLACQRYFFRGVQEGGVKL